MFVIKPIVIILRKRKAKVTRSDARDPLSLPLIVVPQKAEQYGSRASYHGEADYDDETFAQVDIKGSGDDKHAESSSGGGGHDDHDVMK